MKDLKPCPFCGKKAKIRSFRSDGISYFVAYCVDENCMGNRCEYDGSPGFDVEVERWNRRAAVETLP